MSKLAPTVDEKRQGQLIYHSASSASASPAAAAAPSADVAIQTEFTARIKLVSSDEKLSLFTYHFEGIDNIWNSCTFVVSLHKYSVRATMPGRWFPLYEKLSQLTAVPQHWMTVYFQYQPMYCGLWDISEFRIMKEFTVVVGRRWPDALHGGQTDDDPHYMLPNAPGDVESLNKEALLNAIKKWKIPDCGSGVKQMKKAVYDYLTKQPAASTDALPLRRITVDYEKLSAHLKSNVLCQDMTIDEFVVRLRMCWKFPASQGMWTAHLAGPSSVGKTELVNSLVTFLKCNNTPCFIQYSGSNLNDEQGVTVLQGAAPGLVGHGEGATLRLQLVAAAKWIQQDVKQRGDIPIIVWFDELNQAHSQVRSYWMMALDGKVSDFNDPQPIDVRSRVLFLFGSNYGAKQLADYEFRRQNTPKNISYMKALVNGAMRDAKIPEWHLNRFNRTVIPFSALSDHAKSTISVQKIKRAIMGVQLEPEYAGLKFNEATFETAASAFDTRGQAVRQTETSITDYLKLLVDQLSKPLPTASLSLDWHTSTRTLRLLSEMDQVVAQVVIDRMDGSARSVREPVPEPTVDPESMWGNDIPHLPPLDDITTQHVSQAAAAGPGADSHHPLPVTFHAIAIPGCSKRKREAPARGAETKRKKPANVFEKQFTWSEADKKYVCNHCTMRYAPKQLETAQKHFRDKHQRTIDSAAAAAVAVAAS